MDRRPSSTPFALSVACPHCGSRPNIQCVVISGQETEDGCHPARVALSKRDVRTDAREPTPDAVNHPKHYGGANDPYETIKVMEAWHGPEAVRWFCILSAEKYLSRMGKKPGEPMQRDLKKATWYLEYAAKLSEKIEKQLVSPDND